MHVKNDTSGSVLDVLADESFQEVRLSGTGKTYFLETLIRQDIEHRTGCVVFDVHGDLAESLVAYIAGHCEKHPDLLNRVALVEPFDATHTIGFNPLERTADTPAFFQAQELA